jgi:hypothetical protein
MRIILVVELQTGLLRMTKEEGHLARQIPSQNINIDTLPPVLEYLLVYNNKTLIIHYNEYVNIEQAQDTLNYLISVNHIDSAVVDPLNPYDVYLYFSDNFEPGVEQFITIQQVADLCGNGQDAVFESFIFYLVKPYDVVINEIMSDPSPVVGLPIAEYVELYNRTDYDIDLIGWSFASETTVKQIPACKIPAKGYLILANKMSHRFYQIMEL